MTAVQAMPRGAERGAGPRRPEQARARYPDATGDVIRDGIRISYEVYGEGEPTIVFVPTWSIVHSRIWKAQLPFFARRHRVVTFDARGNGRSDRPTTAAAYAEAEMARDILAIMDEVSVDRAVLVSLSLGAQRALIASGLAPDRVAGQIFVCPSVPIGEGLADRAIDFDRDDGPDTGWARYNASSWRRDYRGFLEFFFGRCFNEPHSTKPIEDSVDWGMEIGPEQLILSEQAPDLDAAETRALCATIRCPTLVIQGDLDAITGLGRGVGLAAAIPGATLTRIAGGGHLPSVRDPVRVNLTIRDFLAGLPGR